MIRKILYNINSYNYYNYTDTIVSVCLQLPYSTLSIHLQKFLEVQMNCLGLYFTASKHSFRTRAKVTKNLSSPGWFEKLPFKNFIQKQLNKTLKRSDSLSGVLTDLCISVICGLAWTHPATVISRIKKVVVAIWAC